MREQGAPLMNLSEVTWPLGHASSLAAPLYACSTFSVQVKELYNVPNYFSSLSEIYKNILTINFVTPQYLTERPYGGRGKQS